MVKSSKATRAKPARTLTVVQIHSGIGCPGRQRRTLQSLGLRRIRHRNQLPDLPSVRGMVNAISHLVRIEEPPSAHRGDSKS
ncbi:MAG: 50S ribosomal protein L30 [Acidobacteria bacterium]|nr:50S ribosomal protein L30 [Acidobacteriota bacterium]